jgi:hypothetical protein
MSAASQSLPNQNRSEGRPAPPRSLADAAGVEPRLAYRTSLARYKGARLAAIRLAQGASPDGSRIRPVGNADEITEHLDQPAAVDALVVRLETGPRLALSLFALTDAKSISLAGLTHSLGILATEPIAAIVRLLELGLLAIEPLPDLGPVDDFEMVLLRGSPTRVRLRAHPAVVNGARTARPEAAPKKIDGSVRQVRESDGLEPILRLGALWQRVGVEPLRQTHQGTLYKRDRDRLMEDPVLACAIADAPKTLPGLPSLWLELAYHVGLIQADKPGERLFAASAEFWAENAVHLPQMIATGWLGLQAWQEVETRTSDDNAPVPALPYLRLALLLWLSALADTEWAGMGDLASQLSERWPQWDRLSLVDAPDVTSAARGRGGPPAARARSRAVAEGPPRGLPVLESVLLGAAYPLGLVRVAEEVGTGQVVVQLTQLGRYALALGPVPPLRPTFDQFLFVQPNFEMIAYRQGLTPQLAGRLSQLGWWSQIGSALELKLTRESIVHGLDGGMTAETILEILTRHSQRALPHGITDAVTNWASRRERVTYYGSATLIEFGSPAERDDAIAFWPTSDIAAPIAVADRFLLVEDDKTVPFDRLRLISSRDYRRPPEICALVQADGVTMALDPARSDLLVEAELARFADLVTAPQTEAQHSGGAERRHFGVTAASLRRGMARGMTAAQLADWYARRTGGEMPPAVRLLLAARSSRVPPLKAARMLVINLANPDLLDGLIQHPTSGPLLGSRLGPTSVVIADEKLPLLQKALKELGIELQAQV